MHYFYGNTVTLLSPFLTNIVVHPYYNTMCGVGMVSRVAIVRKSSTQVNLKLTTPKCANDQFSCASLRKWFQQTFIGVDAM